LRVNRALLYRALFAACFHAGFLLALFFDPEDGGDMFPRKHWLTFNGLHGVISQKTVLFITTAVRTSIPTKLLVLIMLMRVSFLAFAANNALKVFLGDQQRHGWAKNQHFGDYAHNTLLKILRCVAITSLPYHMKLYMQKY
jgi:hypothetical protein